MKTKVLFLLASIALIGNAFAENETIHCENKSGTSYFNMSECDYIYRNGESGVGIGRNAGYRLSNFKFNGYKSNEPSQCFRRSLGGLVTRYNLSAHAEEVKMYERNFAIDPLEDNQVKIVYQNGKSEIFRCEAAQP